MRMPSILKKVVKMLHLEKDASEQKKIMCDWKGTVTGTKLSVGIFDIFLRLLKFSTNFHFDS